MYIIPTQILLATKFFLIITLLMPPRGRRGGVTCWLYYRCVCVSMWQVCAWVCVCMRVCACTCSLKVFWTCVCVCMRLSVRVWVNECVYVCVFVCFYVCVHESDGTLSRRLLLGVARRCYNWRCLAKITNGRLGENATQAYNYIWGNFALVIAFAELNCIIAKCRRDVFLTKRHTFDCLNSASLVLCIWWHASA